MERFRALEYLAGHEMFPPRRIEADGLPTIDVMIALLERLERPDRRAKLVQVTGTNGKSSTSRTISELLAAATAGHSGARVARYIDRSAEDEPGPCDPALPVLRWPVDVPPSRMAALLRRIAEAEAALGVPLAYHEVLLAACFVWFAEEHVDVAVLEVAMGGRRDLTSAADAAVAAVTNVQHDHLDLLGPTLAHVAAQKAGVVKPGTHLVLGETDPALCEPFLRSGAAAIWRRDADWGVARDEPTATGRALDLFVPGRVYRALELRHAGRWQGDNAALAVATAQALLGAPIDDAVVRRVVAAPAAPGRFELLSAAPVLVLDAAKNPDGMAALAEALAERYPGRRLHTAVVAVWRPLDAQALLAPLVRLRPGRLIVVPLRPQVDDGAASVRAALAAGVPAVELSRTVAEALELALAGPARDDLVVVTGSTKIVRPARAALRARQGRQPGEERVDLGARAQPNDA